MSSSKESNQHLFDNDMELLELEKLLCATDGPNRDVNKLNAVVVAQTKPNSNVNEDSDAELLELEKLLSGPDYDESVEISKVKATASTQAPVVPTLREDETFAEAFSYQVDASIETKSEKLLTKLELDSSDDEEVNNFLERKYNEYGCEMNKRLKQQRSQQQDEKIEREVNAALNSTAANNSLTKERTSPTIKNPHRPVQRKSHLSNSFKETPQNHSASTPAIALPPAQPVYTDPIFGLRIIKPLVSSSLLVERMAGRKAVAFSGLDFHIKRNDLSKDWVIGGVVTSKMPVMKTKKGDPFSIWRLSDLRGDIKMISLFLFQDAHKEFWKLAEGTCVAVLNPNICEKQSEKGDIAALSINTSRKVMVLGQSKDFGVCKGRKKNDQPCSAIVNLTECDYCVFHIRSEFTKMSRRAELQSDSTGRGLAELRNKILGKSEVFYGGKSFTAIPAKKSSKLAAKDQERLSALSEYAVSPLSSSVNHISKPKKLNTPVPYASAGGVVSKCAANMEINTTQRIKDLERLKLLQADTAPIISEKKVNPKESISIASPKNELSAVPASTTPTVPEKFKNRTFSIANHTPSLSRENFCIEVSIDHIQCNRAKAKAQELLKKSPVVRSNPNSLRGSKEGKRRAIDDLNDKFKDNERKRQKISEQEMDADRKTRLQRIIEAASSHTNLIDMREQQEQEKYFNKLEKKEELEEKMLKTYKVPCKAVICLRCKYTAFSAANRCKEERHPLKVIDAEKRFFQCADCGYRTATVFKLPKISCKTCKSSSWERTAMIRERNICTPAEVLSVRGDEEGFFGSMSSKVNLNLMVPEE